MSWHCHPTGSPWLAGALGTVSKQPCATPLSMAVQPRDRPVPSDPLPSSQGDPGVADEPPDTDTGCQGCRLQGGPHSQGAESAWMGQAPQEQEPGKAGTPLPREWERESWVCKEVAGAHAGPSSAEEPPPACVQSSVERSGSLPPAACLPAACSNFLYIVPTAAATVPCASPPCTAQPGSPCLATRTLPHRPANIPAYIPAPFTDALCSPPQQRDPCPTPPCEQRGGLETAGPAQGLIQGCGLQPWQL